MKLYRTSREIASNKKPTMQLQCSLRSATVTVDNEEHVEDEAQNVNPQEFGSSSMIILNFREHVPLKLSTCIFVDNYSPSHRLIKKITNLGYGITGTLRFNCTRGCRIPSENNKKKPHSY